MGNATLIDFLMMIIWRNYYFDYTRHKYNVIAKIDISQRPCNNKGSDDSDIYFSWYLIFTNT